MRSSGRFSATLILLGALCAGLCVQAAPSECVKYQRDLTREARAAWGMGAPIATFAAQMYQESNCRPGARSAYASGLAQFTPDTAKWIGGAYAQLADPQPLNPQWAIRALVVYDLHLWTGLAAASACDRMAMALAAYNGGAGWISREKRATLAAGGDPQRWYKHVELNCIRSPASCKENRGYPRKILQRWQEDYAAWGPVITCPASV